MPAEATRLPKPLPREPNTDLTGTRNELDKRVFKALESIARLIENGDRSRFAFTSANLIKSMKQTHRSMVALFCQKDDTGKSDLNYAVDTLLLARAQVERMVVCALLNDDSKWLDSYWRNLFRNKLITFLRDRERFRNIPKCTEDYTDARLDELLEWGRSKAEGDVFGCAVSEKGIQAIMFEAEYGQRRARKQHRDTFVEPMPSTPSSAIEQLVSPELKSLVGMFRDPYERLCHYAHGGLGAVMIGGVVRSPLIEDPSSAFFMTEVFYPGYLVESVALISAVTALGVRIGDTDGIAAIMDAWSPFLCDGTPLGIEVWDVYAKKALGALG